jgi:endonuclease/exonuclease/phosphatase family metal-dependent hydrolase
MTRCVRRLASTAIVSLALVASFAACKSQSAVPKVSPAPATASSLRVMSFNLRYNNPADGVNAWPNRRDWVASLMRFHDVDVVGVQEALAPMLGDLDARLPGFARFGVGRTDGVAAGEFSAILYRKDRLSVQDSGTFWLSPTPTVVGSKGWDAALERIATWGRFRDRRTGCAFLMLNTHFDHIGEIARQNSSRVIREQLLKLAGALPIVVTGDLNSDPASGGYRVLTRDTLANAVGPLLDGFTHSVSGHYGPTSTWTAFKAIEPGRRIDYVMVSPGVVVLSHGILPDSWDGRFPSDHLPVLATVAPCR